ncbi:MAG: substrate-binding domain-containing protein, partial [Planctomycetota bacterium]
NCPKDLSLLAMEDVPELAWCEPQFSAVKIPFDWLGREAARRLLTLIEASDEIESTIKPDEILPSLVLRASTASPPIKPKPVP